MAHDPLFSSAWLKWGQAVHHAEALLRELESPAADGRDDPLGSVEVRYHRTRHGFGLYALDVVPTPARWGLLLGDVASNYRCALDHLAWAVVVRGRTPPRVLSDWAQRKVYFPIARSRGGFNEMIALKLPGASGPDIARVRRPQPYHYGSRTQLRHSLVVLHDLNNRDKHRAIQPVWEHPTRLDIKITGRCDCDLSGTIPFVRTSEPLRSGAELAFIRARKTGPSPSLEVRTRCAATPSIDNRISAREWLAQTSLLIGVLLTEFTEAPPEVVETAAWLVD